MSPPHIAITTINDSGTVLLSARSIVFSEMEHAKKMDDPTATVCAELSNHEVKVPLCRWPRRFSGM